MKTIGIDLGTTYSCVSYVDDFGVLRVIENAEGELTTPSVVYFDTNGEVRVGTSAKEKGEKDPMNYCERVKNYVGDSCYSFTTENGKSYSAREICKFILQKVVRDAEAALGEEIGGAVITIPDYFGMAAKMTTVEALRSVSLSNGKNIELFFVLLEPIAAALTYKFFRRNEKEKTLLIYDLGGGTLDETVIKINEPDRQFETRIITAAGNHQLGGIDWNAALTDLVVQKFCAETGCDPDAMKADPECRAWLSEQIEQAKKRLTAKDNTALTPQFEGQKAKITITRDEFEEATEGLLSETISLVDKMLADKGLTMAQDIDEIVLIGGSTFMPQVKNRLDKEYGKPLASYEPNKAVARGAALMANGLKITQATDETTPADDITGNNPGPMMGTIMMDENANIPVPHPICTKSYGIRYYANGAQVYGNFILKDTPKPAHGSSVGKLELCITGKPDLVYEVPILVFETDCMDELVPEDQVNLIYMEESIKLEEPVPGNVQISIDMDVDINGILSLELKELGSGKTYKMLPRRKSDESDKEGMDQASNMTLII